MKFLQMYVTASMLEICMPASQGGGTLRRWNSQRGSSQEVEFTCWGLPRGGILLLEPPTSREFKLLGNPRAEDSKAHSYVDIYIAIGYIIYIYL